MKLTPPPARFRTQSTALAGLASGALAVLALGCGDSEPTNPAGAPSPGVAITPENPIVWLGDSLQFTAVVSGQAPGVRWSLAPGNPSTPDLGSITAGGLYFSPASGSGPRDFEVMVTATSTLDTTLSGSTRVTIPRIRVNAQPALLTSIPPGTAVPFAIDVKYAHDPGFLLWVDGIPGGNADVGTFTPSGPGAAIYGAPVIEPRVTAYSLLVQSAQAPQDAFAAPLLNVRGGFPLPGDPSRHQLSPEWDPSGTRVAYVEGPPWQIVVHDPVSHARTPLAAIEWSGALYGGRLSWSPGGDRICFGEEQGGRRVVGWVEVAGGGRSIFDPDGVSEFRDGVFLPTGAGAPESLLVVVRSGSDYELRAFPLLAGAGESGLSIYDPPGGTVLREPDAARLDGALHVTAVREASGSQEIIAFAADGGPLDLYVKDPEATAPVAHPVWTPQSGVDRITYVSVANGTAYRFTFQGGADPVRLYAEFFPEQSVDRVDTRPQHVVMSRLHPDGWHRAWVVEFPPVDYLPKPSEEEELRAASGGSALSPAQWEQWAALGRAGLARR